MVFVLGAGVDAATHLPWMAMELLEGESLAAYMRSAGPLSPTDAAEVLRPLCATRWQLPTASGWSTAI